MTDLFIDDVRTPPEGWDWAKTYDEAISMVGNGYEAISLDHDLSEQHYMAFIENSDYELGTGYDILKFMAMNNIWPDILAIHSGNPVGRKNMFDLIESTRLYDRPIMGSIGQWTGVTIFRKK